jgi:glycosyltransferase involved in cell wall biosynthesis
MSLSSNDFPLISFGIIVLNGEPFTKYCLRQLYPHAYEIIVVEGGSEKAAGFAPEGRSTDGTLEALREFQEQEDPENKLRMTLCQVAFPRGSGTWPGNGTTRKKWWPRCWVSTMRFVSLGNADLTVEDMSLYLISAGPGFIDRRPHKNFRTKGVVCSKSAEKYNLMGISAILLTAGRLEKKRSFFGIEPPMEGTRPFFNRGGQGCRIISANK